MRVLLSAVVLIGLCLCCEGGVPSNKMVLPPKAIEIGEPELPAWDPPLVEEVTYVPIDKLAAVEQDVASAGKTAWAAFASALVSF
jgi:hypothetical protein